jgi:uncharacterized protein YfaT (DUF1175 family)
MRSQAKPRAPRLFVAVVVALAVLLLLLRLLVFTHGYGHHLFRGGTTGAATVRQAAFAKPANIRPAPVMPALLMTDRFGDGTPDFLRLTDPSDQLAFRQWFTDIAEFQAIVPRASVPAEISDCASLLRYAYREALKRHDDTWYNATGMQLATLPGEIRAWHYPDTPLGASLFRVRPGTFAAPDLNNGSFAQFADAKTLVQRNSYFVTRDVRLAQPGDLLFYRQFGQSSPWHSMIVTQIADDPAVVYNTGPGHSLPGQEPFNGDPEHAIFGGGPAREDVKQGKSGEMRLVTIKELLQHPQPQWRPLPGNPNFLGVYRWNILRGTL